MNEPFIFVTGMFRSGTTLLARLLQAHQRVAFASDPYSWLFKSLRNQLAFELHGSVDEDAPLNDYYYDDDQLAVMTAIQRAAFATTPVRCDRDVLLKRIAAKLRPYSPAIEPLLKDLHGETYGEMLQSGLGLIRRAYGDAETTRCGFKEVWTNEFAPVIVNACPNAKVVCIVRDPRAVAASNNVTDAKYPWVFLVRQWRKLAAFAWLMRGHPRVCLLRFEELVIDPARQVERLCAFLDIEFEQRLIDPTCYVDGAGQPWTQNTNYKNPKRAFDAAAVDRWRETLTPSVQAYIESVCRPEMLMLGYRPEIASSEMSFIPPNMTESQLSSWIRPYSVLNEETRERDATLERSRWDALSSDVQVSQAEQRRLYLSEDVFESARQQWHGSEVIK